MSGQVDRVHILVELDFVLSDRDQLALLQDGEAKRVASGEDHLKSKIVMISFTLMFSNQWSVGSSRRHSTHNINFLSGPVVEDHLILVERVNVGLDLEYG